MDKYTQELLDAAREALAQQELEQSVEHTLRTRNKQQDLKEQKSTPLSTKS